MKDNSRLHCSPGILLLDRYLFIFFIYATFAPQIFYKAVHEESVSPFQCCMFQKTVCFPEFLKSFIYLK